jgi:hypothetical protein
MRLAIDTNRYRDFCEGRPDAVLVHQHDLLLYSRDAHFDALPQLGRV